MSEHNLQQRTCRVEFCANPIRVKSRQLCLSHYERWKKHGDSLGKTWRVLRCDRWHFAVGPVGFIQMSNGSYAMCDRNNFDTLKALTWYVQKGYATTRIKGKMKTMHMLIIKTSGGMVRDHINQDKMDNRRRNLRLAPPFINVMNGRAHKDSHSGLRGVRKSHKRWQAIISVRGKAYCIGSYDTPEEASDAYEAKRKEIITSVLSTL